MYIVQSYENDVERSQYELDIREDSGHGWFGRGRVYDILPLMDPVRNSQE